MEGPERAAAASETRARRSSWGPLLWAGLAFIAFCVAAYWAWAMGLGAIYAAFFKKSASFWYSLFGVAPIPIALNRPQYLNWIPFIGFMLVTYKVNWKRRSISALVGLCVLHFAHLFLNASPHVIAFGREGLDPLAPAPTLMIISDGLPLLLWAILFPELFTTRESVQGVQSR